HLVAHARLPIIRGKSGLASFQQCCHSRPGHHSAIFCPRLADRKKWRSAFVAAIFAIHPLRAESVAWIAERKDVLSGLFFALTLLAWSNYARRKSVARYLIALCAAALGTLSKPMMVTIPFVLLLLDYWPLNRFQKEKLISLVLEKIPFGLFAAASAVATVLAQHGQIDT